MAKGIRHFLDISEVQTGELNGIISHSRQMKDALKSGDSGNQPLKGKVLAMIFDKPSTRTRVSFDVGMRQLGGETIFLSSNDTQLGRGESIADTARVLSRMVDAIMIRTTSHDRLLEMAEYASIPVINALTDDTHPCQVMADVMTFEEHRGPIAGKKLAWTGDGNNMVASLAHGAARFGYDLAVATPDTRKPAEKFIKWAQGEGANISLSDDPNSVVSNADCVITDTWVSMGDEEDSAGHNVFLPYQVNAELMAKADENALFMHCLPAHRNEEVTDEVIDGPQSVVFDEAENRLHVQKGILAWCFGLKGQ
ncbi:MAG: ornithine carbamoyltransferase [Rhizobiaceae bacterium]|nr:ornithine carbamoyltransferase [Rhizobiaceae bacterium]